MRNANKFVASLTVALPLVIGGVLSASWLATAPSPVYAQDAHPELPAGAGRDLVLTTCTKCHTTANITAQRRDRDAWTATITKMVGYGATGSDEDLEGVLDYLTRNFGPDSPAPATGATPAPAPAAGTAPAPSAKIDVNKETAAQLKTDLALTDDEAKSVVDYRAKNGSFKSLDDLKKVPNVDAKKLDAKKDSLLFS